MNWQSDYKSMSLEQIVDESFKVFRSNDKDKLEKLKFLKCEALARPNKFLEYLYK